MATLKEAREALDYLQGRIDAGSMAGERLAVIGEYLSGQHISNGADVGRIPKPYNTTTDLTTNACANCIEQGIIQPGCQHD